MQKNPRRQTETLKNIFWVREKSLLHIRKICHNQGNIQGPFIQIVAKKQYKKIYGDHKWYVDNQTIDLTLSDKFRKIRMTNRISNFGLMGIGNFVYYDAGN